MALFDFLSEKKLSQSQLQQIHRQEKILSDSLKIIMSTENLSTFFVRYKDAKDSINMIGMIAGTNVKCIAKGEASALECLESLEKEFPAQLNNCLSRYVRKETIHILGLSRGRMNKAKGVLAIIEEFATDMPAECFEHGKYLANKLIEKVEALEKG